MKTHKHFTQPDEKFFDRQAFEIEENTLGLDTWKLKGTGSVENFYRVPEGYWLNMEEGIRQRIRKPESVWSLSLITWKPALASLMILLAIGIGVRYYLNHSDSENLAALQLEQLKQEEILLYLTENTEDLEFSQQVAVQSLPENALEIPIDYNDEDLLEENNLNETDFESSL